MIPTSIVKVMSKRKIINMNCADTSDDEDEDRVKFASEIPESNQNDLSTSTVIEVAESTPHLKSYFSLDPYPSEENNNKNDQFSLTVQINRPYDTEEEGQKSEKKEQQEKGNKKEEEEKDEDDNEKEDEKEDEVPESPLIGAIKKRMSSLSGMFRQKRYKQLEEQQEKEVDPEHKKIEGKKKEKKQKKNGKHSRLDVSSLSAVTRKLHLSYIVAIACIVIAFLVSYLTIRIFLADLVQVASDMELADKRTQYIQAISMDMALLVGYPRDGSIESNNLIISTQSDLDNLLITYNAIKPKTYQMAILYTSNCFLINQTLCLNASDPNYVILSNGFDYAFFKMYVITQVLIDRYKSTNTSLSLTDPDYKTFRIISEYMIDGAETLTYLVYKDAKDKINHTKSIIGIITGVVSAAFIFIYFVLFRPFVKQLKAESDHTFSLIRMIPRKLLKDVPELQQLIQETLYTGYDSDNE